MTPKKLLPWRGMRLLSGAQTSGALQNQHSSSKNHLVRHGCSRRSSPPVSINTTPWRSPAGRLRALRGQPRTCPPRLAGRVRKARTGARVISSARFRPTAPNADTTSSTSEAMRISTSTTTSTSPPSSARRIAVAGTPAAVVLSGVSDGDVGPGSLCSDRGAGGPAPVPRIRALALVEPGAR